MQKKKKNCQSVENLVEKDKKKKKGNCKALCPKEQTQKEFQNLCTNLVVSQECFR